MIKITFKILIELEQRKHGLHKIEQSELILKHIFDVIKYAYI